MRKSTSDIAAGAFTSIFALLFLARSGKLSGISWMFPRALIIILFFGGVYLIVKGVLHRRKQQEKTTTAADPVAVHRILVMGLASLAYALCIPLLGFYSSSLLFLIASALLLGKRPITRKQTTVALLFAGMLCLVVWGGFNVLLSVPTPTGILF